MKLEGGSILDFSSLNPSYLNLSLFSPPITPAGLVHSDGTVDREVPREEEPPAVTAEEDRECC